MMVSTMPSKLRKALGAVKDQTSISIAKVSNTNAANLEVLILKATTHDEIPIEERYVTEILLLIYSNKVYASACAHAISKRIGRTRNWIVALKSLMLVLRIFQDGDPYFPREVLHAMKRGAKILNLSNFRDDSNSSPWDYTAFVRTFGLYLDERLDCFLTGKLQRRVTYRQKETKGRHKAASPVRDMKPVMLLDRISYWQRLLDRAIGTRPTGAAKTNRLVMISLYTIVQESFDLYRDISDGLALLLDSFFHLKYQSCANAFQACIKATKQFEELSGFYDLCKNIGVGRTSEYPSVQKISEELIETLQEFLKDQDSFPSHNGRRSPSLLPMTLPRDPGSSSEKVFYDQSEGSERFSKRGGSEFSTSRCTSLEDLMSLTEFGANPGMSTIEQEYYSEDQQSEKQYAFLEDLISTNDDDSGGSNCSLPLEQETNSSLDLVSFDDDWAQNEVKQEIEQQQLGNETSETSGLEILDGSTNGWELVLFESAAQQVQPSTSLANGFESSVVNDLFTQASLPQHQYNPFLHDVIPTPIATTSNDPPILPVDHMFSVTPTFHVPAAPTFSAQVETVAAAPTFCSQNLDEKIVAPTFCAENFSETTTGPTFCAKNPNETIATVGNEEDPFATWHGEMANEHISNGSMNQQSLLHQQQLWLEQQNKIIAKHIS
jgi:hypothetical protein